MAKKVNIGIIGCASIAKKYAINAFKALDEVDKIFLSSRDVGKSKSWAKEFDIFYKNSYDELITDNDIDAVYVPLPISLHEELVVKAASMKKHAICEKSLSHSFESAKKMVEACKKNSVLLFENFMCDYHPQHEKVLSLIEKGEIGKSYIFKGYFGFPPLNENNFRYNKELGGGSLNDAGSYIAFMARKIFRTEPVTVTCNLDFKDGEVDMHGSALLEFPNNKAAFIGFGFDNVYQNNYSVWGSKGMITVKRAYSLPPDLKPPIELYKNIDFKDSFEQIDAPAANHFELIFRDFCQTILNKDDGKRKTMYEKLLYQARTLEAMRLSAKENRKVEINKVM